MLVTEVLVDAEDQLFAYVAGKIQVDVRHRGHLLVEEAAQEEIVLDRVDVGETDEIADKRTDGGATPPTRGRVTGAALDFFCHPVGELEDLLMDEEEPCQPVVLHQR